MKLEFTKSEIASGSGVKKERLTVDTVNTPYFKNSSHLYDASCDDSRRKSILELKQQKKK